MIPLVLNLVLLLSFSISAPSSFISLYRHLSSVESDTRPKLRLDPPCVATATRGSCAPRVVVDDFFGYEAMAIAPVRTRGGKPLDDDDGGMMLAVGIDSQKKFIGRVLVIRSNCSPSIDFPLYCSTPDLNNTPHYCYSTTLHAWLYRLDCTTLVYTPTDHDWDCGGIWDTLEVDLYVSWAENVAWCDVCFKSGGNCTTNQTIVGRSCHYHYSFPHVKDCPPRGKQKAKTMKKIMFGGFATTGFVFLLFFSLCFYRRLNTSILCGRKSSRKDENFEAFLEKFQNLVPARYSYSHVEEITSSFSHKLGQGGYGSVYKGKLKDGRHVAVKVLNDSKRSVKDFFAEVIAIGCTYHVNIVTLLGLCADGPKRVLIYEFMSNGSLEKFIFDKKQATTTLDGANLLKIAIGVARGLEYLHHGCNIGILHFDIKPHNILLDHDFCPKIADFGLAKLCRSAEGTTKMLGARGTIGYIAPEVFSRSYGGASSKSDVYSYGMMLLEMVGGRKNFTVQEVDHTSEVYFPHWICKHLRLDGNLKSLRTMTKVEEEIARRMVSVGLWCIQTKPSDRPSMTKVLGMLEGRITELPVPPVPFCYSPPRSAMHSLTSHSDEIVSVVTS